MVGKSKHLKDFYIISLKYIKIFDVVFIGGATEMFKVKRSRNATNKTCLLFISKEFWERPTVWGWPKFFYFNLLGEQVLVEVKDKDKNLKWRRSTETILETLKRKLLKRGAGEAFWKFLKSFQLF